MNLRPFNITTRPQANSLWCRILLEQFVYVFDSVSVVELCGMHEIYKYTEWYSNVVRMANQVRRRQTRNWLRSSCDMRFWVQRSWISYISLEFLRSPHSHRVYYSDDIHSVVSYNDETHGICSFGSHFIVHFLKLVPSEKKIVLWYDK